MDQHALVAAIKDLALELGHTPRRSDLEARVKGGRYALDRCFAGSFSALLTAAGLETYGERRKGPGPARKIDNSIFERDIEAHLEQYKPRPPKDLGPYPTMAIISDIHWPFESQRVIDKFLTYVERHRPEWVIVNGDAWDMYSHTKFPRSHNQFTPREEQALARKKNEDFWRGVQSLAPEAKCVAMLGNHDIRPMKRILETYPEAEDWIAEKLKELFTFDGVKTIHDPREPLYIREDIVVFHGYKSGLGAHRDSTLYSCFIGHTHKGGTVWKPIRGSAPMFECNSGLAGDPEAKGLTYTPSKITDWTPGFAACDEWGPRFIPV